MARAHHVRQEMLVLASWSWPLGPSGLGVKRLAVSMKGREGMWPGEGSLSHVEGVGSGGMGASARCGGSGAAASAAKRGRWKLGGSHGSSRAHPREQARGDRERVGREHIRKL
jgi:hypothetical protein